VAILLQLSFDSAVMEQLQEPQSGVRSQLQALAKRVRGEAK